MDSLRSTVAVASACLVVLPFAVTAVGDAFGTVPDPAPQKTPNSAPVTEQAAPAPFGVPQTSVAPTPIPAGAQIPGDG